MREKKRGLLLYPASRCSSGGSRCHSSPGLRLLYFFLTTTEAPELPLRFSSHLFSGATPPHTPPTYRRAAVGLSTHKGAPEVGAACFVFEPPRISANNNTNRNEAAAGGCTAKPHTEAPALGGLNAPCDTRSGMDVKPPGRPACGLWLYTVGASLRVSRCLNVRAAAASRPTSCGRR